MMVDLLLPRPPGAIKYMLTEQLLSEVVDLMPAEEAVSSPPASHTKQ
jgi:hypothetical protein